jgi:tRNA G18 (ribose-2'-O)-methylase SpoU
LRRALTTLELRHSKLTRDEFLTRQRRTITVVLDGVTQNYNIGDIFWLCNAFLVQELIVCGTKVDLHKRRLVQEAQGTQHWGPGTSANTLPKPIIATVLTREGQTDLVGLQGGCFLGGAHSPKVFWCAPRCIGSMVE